jgi:hypothetical protein
MKEPLIAAITIDELLRCSIGEVDDHLIPRQGLARGGKGGEKK